MSENAEFIRRYFATLPHDIKDIYADRAELDRFTATLESRVAPSFHIELVGPPGSGFGERFEGLDGFISGWREWTTPYETYLFETTRIEDFGDAVLADGRQRATLAGSPEVIETHVSSVWRFADGQITSVEFHLDRELARERAASREAP